MNLFASALPFLSAASLALFVGALFTEAVVLVPMWRAMPPQEFFSLHAAHAHRLYGFFAPLTVSATVLAVGAGVTAVITHRPSSAAAGGTAARSRGVLSTNFM